MLASRPGLEIMVVVVDVKGALVVREARLVRAGREHVGHGRSVRVGSELFFLLNGGLGGRRAQFARKATFSRRPAFVLWKRVSARAHNSFTAPQHFCLPELVRNTPTRDLADHENRSWLTSGRVAPA